MSWLQRRGHGGGSLDVLSKAEANSRSEPTTKRWSDTWGKARDSMSVARGGKARAAQAKIRGSLDQALLGRGGGELGWATPFETVVVGGTPEGGMNSGANCCSRGCQERGSTRPPLEDSMATTTAAM
jgi:hypothetical protein